MFQSLTQMRVSVIKGLLLNNEISSSTRLRQGFGWQASLDVVYILGIPRPSSFGRRLPAVALAKEGLIRTGKGATMKYVYLIRSIKFPEKKYIVITSDLQSRIKDHSFGKSTHTSKFKPWSLAVAIKFEENQKALAFEKYLKSGSGRAFANRHLW